MKLSIIIPVRNEEFSIKKTIDQLQGKLKILTYEIIFINDYSDDNTFEVIKNLIKTNPQINIYNNQRKGLGGAIAQGIDRSSGEAVCIMMSDLSDSIEDLEKYYNIIKDENVDAVFGSRFIQGSNVVDYPKKKFILNRIFNLVTKIAFLSDYNDFTNAFKIYKKTVLLNIMPLISESFNIFLEIPLKIISRNYRYKVVSINWMGRKRGESKFRIKELRSKYLFTLIYCFIEKNLLNIKK